MKETLLPVSRILSIWARMYIAIESDFYMKRLVSTTYEIMRLDFNFSIQTLGACLSPYKAL